MNDDFLFKFIQTATAGEDQAFEKMLLLIQPGPPPPPDVPGQMPVFNPGIITAQTAFLALLQQEQKMRKISQMPQSVQDLESKRTEAMRTALQDKLGEHFDAWYAATKKAHPDLA